MVNVRFTYLPDEQKRKELMIIYAEDMAPTGLTFAQLVQDNKTSERGAALWAPVEKDLIERARKSITIHKIGQ